MMETHEMLTTPPPRALAADAERFLLDAGASRFVGPISAADAETFLQAERSRLGTKVGATMLDERARGVIAIDQRINNSIDARVYCATTSDRSKPVILYIHGGGWVSGGIEQHDSTCRILAVEADAVVINTDYRLSPENAYPAALDDCDAVLRWVRAGAGGSFPIDTSRIALCGSSSGGTLAAALALRASRNAGESVALQVLIYPALDSTMSGDSYRTNGTDYFITADQMAWYWDSYRGLAVDTDPEFSPLAAPNLSDSPPTIIVTADYDLLRDDGAKFAEKLATDGVPVRRIHFPGQIHGFMGLLESISDAYPAISALGKMVGAVLRDGKNSAAWQSGAKA